MTRPPTSAPVLHLYLDPSGYIDATWWPRSSDLAAELPDLVTALRLRAGPIWRVVYDPNLWSPAPSHLELDDQRIRLDPYPFELFGTVYVCGLNGTVIVVEAIPCENDPAEAAETDRPITNHAAMGSGFREIAR
ncbi:DUF5994 family protein [Nocardia takedensis]|uniref:DUF5994 family protein n=1 Tax=Nocardia takedensis TaxID=259390 RepID=UPI0012F63E12|nr:DUF5994 family protein [Nocardia takedensis]